MARSLMVGEVKEAKISKAKIKEFEIRLKNLIPVYGQNKSQMDDFKKVVEADNKEIKSICKVLSVENMEVEGYKMSYKVIDKHNVNEDKVLEIVKKWWAKKNGSMECPYIKTREYLDNDALQDAIYNGEIDKQTLLKIRECDEVKKEERLTVSKAKEKKNGQ